MDLIDVQEWDLTDPDQPVDKTKRCTHGRPLNGNPCRECPCRDYPCKVTPPIHQGTKAFSEGAKRLVCIHCKAVLSGTPYPYRDWATPACWEDRQPHR